ncbi:MAG: hypothetical protein HYX72_00555 [Acidobacteria bacterium]|nr:hypothetical protein [Acidobacteriota bacterium]
MSAIGIIGTSAGFAIASDGRMRFNEETRLKADKSMLTLETDEAQKIFQIERTDGTIAFTITGVAASNDLKFRLWDETKKHAVLLSESRFPDGLKYVKRLSANLNKEINMAKQAGIIEEFPQNRKFEFGSGWTIARIFFVGYFNSAPCFVHTEFHHSDGNNSEYLITAHPTSCSFLLGPEKIVNAMYGENGRPLNDSPFPQYIKDLNLPSSFEDAKQYVLGFVQACCSPTALGMDESFKMVGGRIHMATITARGGFRWVPGFEPAGA